MKPDSPEYFARVAEILASRPALPAETLSHFVQKPRIELVNIQVDKRHWFFWKRKKTIKGIKLMGDLVYWSRELGYVIEPEGTVSDGASVPDLFWSLFPPFGKDEGSDYALAAVGHDKYCRQGDKGISPIDFKQAALLFREMMVVLNVRKRVRLPMYRAVLYFGPRFRAT